MITGKGNEVPVTSVVIHSNLLIYYVQFVTFAKYLEV